VGQRFQTLLYGPVSKIKKKKMKPTILKNIRWEHYKIILISINGWWRVISNDTALRLIASFVFMS